MAADFATFKTKLKGNNKKNNEYLKYFDDYLIDIKITKTQGTYNFYRNHMLHIGRFFHEHNIKTIKEVDKSVIVEYLTHLKSTVGASTINKRVGIIKRAFVFYDISEHYIFSIGKFKEKKNTFEMISSDALIRIINYIASLDESIGNNLMHKGVIFILINTGVRLNELYNIERKNVRLNEHEILLTKTKSGIDRVIFFRPVIKDVIVKLMNEKHDHKFLFHNKQKNRAINYSDVVHIFNKIKENCKIEKLHPHMFRHTFATNLLQYGVDIKTVMDLMGHTNMSTTQRYQHASKEHAKKSYLEKYKY